MFYVVSNACKLAHALQFCATGFVYLGVSYKPKHYIRLLHSYEEIRANHIRVLISTF